MNGGGATGSLCFPPLWVGKRRRCREGGRVCGRGAVGTAERGGSRGLCWNGAGGRQRRIQRSDSSAPALRMRGARGARGVRGARGRGCRGGGRDPRAGGRAGSGVGAAGRSCGSGAAVCGVCVGRGCSVVRLSRVGLRCAGWGCQQGAFVTRGAAERRCRRGAVRGPAAGGRWRGAGRPCGRSRRLPLPAELRPCPPPCPGAPPARRG